MGALSAVSLRMERRRWQIRAFRKRAELRCVADRTNQIGQDDVLAFATIRNEALRLPFFLEYYRRQGVSHFFFVDNDSDDGGRERLECEEDVSLWTTPASYRRSRFGTDWLNWLKFRYGHGRWTLTLDADEFLIYPFSDTRPIQALCDWLDQSGIRSFGAMLVDMYPRGPLRDLDYQPGQNPFELTPWFDAGNYAISKNSRYGNLWIQGGPRARVFFPDTPGNAPSLNKIPLVKWDRRFTFVASTHMLLPRGLNQVYDEAGGEKMSGCLLHAKFLNTLVGKAAEEVERREHFARGREYDAYHRKGNHPNGLWCEWSERFIDWRQLESLGLMSKGNWA